MTETDKLSEQTPESPTSDDTAVLSAGWIHIIEKRRIFTGEYDDHIFIRISDIRKVSTEIQKHQYRTDAVYLNIDFTNGSSLKIYDSKTIERVCRLLDTVLCCHRIDMR
jgi:hypothetical protein